MTVIELMDRIAAKVEQINEKRLAIQAEGLDYDRDMALYQVQIALNELWDDLEENFLPYDQGSQKLLAA